MCRVGSPKVSVILPTRGRPQYLASTIRSLFRQSYESLEIVVVDQSEARDQLREVPPGVKYITAPPTGASAGRNVGRLHATGEALLFLDDDIVIRSEDFVSHHVRWLRHYDIVTGRVVELRRSAKARIRAVGRVVPVVLVPTGDADSLKGSLVSTVKGGNFSVWTEVYDAVGGFDESFGTPCMYEETEFSLRALSQGFSIYYTPDAVIDHIGHRYGGQRSQASPSKFRYVVFRDRCRLFYRTQHWFWLPAFMLGNVVLAVRPLVNGDIEAAYEGLRGLFDGVRLYSEPRCSLSPRSLARG